MTWIGVLFLAIALGLSTRGSLRNLKYRVHAREEKWVSQLSDRMSEAFWFMEPAKLRRTVRLLVAISALASLLTFSWVPVVLGISALLAAPAVVLRFVQRRRRSLFEKQFSMALPQLSSILHAGQSFERAVETLVRTSPDPLAQEFQLVLKELQLGHPMDAALEGLLSRFPGRDLEIVVRAVQMSRRVGSNLAEVFDRVAEMLRQRAGVRDRLAALTAQGRMQAWIATALPVLLLVPLQFLAPGYITPLFTTALGRLILAGCAVSLTIGGIWAHKISRMEVLR